MHSPTLILYVTIPQTITLFLTDSSCITHDIHDARFERCSDRDRSLIGDEGSPRCVRRGGEGGSQKNYEFEQSIVFGFRRMDLSVLHATADPTEPRSIRTSTMVMGKPQKKPKLGLMLNSLARMSKVILLADTACNKCKAGMLDITCSKDKSLLVCPLVDKISLHFSMGITTPVHLEPWRY